MRALPALREGERKAERKYYLDLMAIAIHFHRSLGDSTLRLYLAMQYAVEVDSTARGHGVWPAFAYMDSLVKIQSLARLSKKPPPAR